MFPPLYSVDQYMGFGLSGSDSSTLMFGADATITWVDTSSQANAVDYHLSAYTQVHTPHLLASLETSLSFQCIVCWWHIPQIIASLRNVLFVPNIVIMQLPLKYQINV